MSRGYEFVKALGERIAATFRLPVYMQPPDEWTVRLRQAEAKGWRMDMVEARVLAEMSVERGLIHPDHLGRLENGLKHGEYMFNGERWVCEFCGGNCGQCGQTGFIGNVPFDFERIVQKANP